MHPRFEWSWDFIYSWTPHSCSYSNHNIAVYDNGPYSIPGNRKLLEDEDDDELLDKDDDELLDDEDDDELLDEDDELLEDEELLDGDDDELLENEELLDEDDELLEAMIVQESSMSLLHQYDIEFLTLAPGFTSQDAYGSPTGTPRGPLEHPKHAALPPPHPVYQPLVEFLLPSPKNIPSMYRRTRIGVGCSKF